MSDQTPRPEDPGAGDPYGGREGNRAGTGPGAGQPWDQVHSAPYGTPPAPPAYGPPGYATPDYGYQARPKSGLAVTALVLGIVAVVFALIPVIGMLSLILGLLALVFGIVALVQRQKKSLAVSGMVLGVLGILIAGAVTAFLTYFVVRTMGDHTVRYRVTTSAPATVTYFNGSQTVDRQVSGNWEEEFRYTGLPIGAVTVSVPDGHASCEVVLDGQRISSNAGNGRVECISAGPGDQGRR
ncbi:DUF4190 domain-containing protein [Arthrobacter sp. GCM10027362]|uniref:DUF4190 domain-containing protein n=1 Tax=Arthrobacter sp. GCM10027362 TaxID=3273379 RepID=UPI0036433D1A